MDKKIILLLLASILFSGCGIGNTGFIIIDANTTEILENITIYPNITTTNYENISGEFRLTEVNNSYYIGNTTIINTIDIEYNGSGFADNITVDDFFGSTTMHISYNERGDIENVTYQKN